MMSSRGMVLAPLWILAVFSAAPREVRAAGDAQVCVAAVEKGQTLHREGKLRGARDKFIACAREECPGQVRSYCMQWLAEVNASLPSLVFGPKLRDGRELRRGTVFFDGEPLRDSLNGRAVPVDPGAHTLRFELEGAKPLTMETVVHEGEKNRLIAPVLEPVAISSAPAPPPPVMRVEPPVTPALRESRPIPPLAYVTGGAALIGIAGFSYFGLKGRGELDDLRSTCGSQCRESDVDSARQKLLVGDVFLAAGIVGAGATLWLILTRPTVREPRVAFDLRAHPGGAGAEFRARF